MGDAFYGTYPGGLLSMNTGLLALAAAVFCSSASEYKDPSDSDNPVSLRAVRLDVVGLARSSTWTSISCSSGELESNRSESVHVMVSWAILDVVLVVAERMV